MNEPNPAPPATGDERCPRCDRVDCLANAGYTHLAALDCAAHAVDWRARALALQRFKDYVHQRLDEAGIPTHPDGEHSKAGCRVGDRLDIVLGEREQNAAFGLAVLDVAREKLATTRVVLERMARHWPCERWAPHAFGETPRFIGCSVHRDPDPATYCLGCDAQVALAALDAAPSTATGDR
jgi:hypothetical protein